MVGVSWSGDFEQVGNGRQGLQQRADGGVDRLTLGRRDGAE